MDRLAALAEFLLSEALSQDGRADIIETIKSHPVEGTFFQKAKALSDRPQHRRRNPHSAAVLANSSLANPFPPTHVAVLLDKTGCECGNIHFQHVDTPEVETTRLISVGWSEGPHMRVWTAEIIGTNSADCIVRLEGRLNGLCQDGKRGFPAKQTYSTPANSLVFTGPASESAPISDREHYTNGKLWDPDEDTPAVCRWWPNGNVLMTTFFKNGLRRQRKNGLPSSSVYNENGTLSREEWYAIRGETDVCHRDPQLGPARIYYNSGIHPPLPPEKTYFLEGKKLHPVLTPSSPLASPRLPLKKGRGLRQSPPRPVVRSATPSD